MTPDQDFVIDKHPKMKNVIIGCGFSGEHSFTKCISMLYFLKNIHYVCDIVSVSLQHCFVLDHVFLCFSGNGFRVAPVIGKILSELALDQTLSYDISNFNVRRFNQTNQSKL